MSPTALQGVEELQDLGLSLPTRQLAQTTCADLNAHEYLSQWLLHSRAHQAITTFRGLPLGQSIHPWTVYFASVGYCAGRIKLTQEAWMENICLQVKLLGAGVDGTCVPVKVKSTGTGGYCSTRSEIAYVLGLLSKLMLMLFGLLSFPPAGKQSGCRSFNEAGRKSLPMVSFSYFLSQWLMSLLKLCIICMQVGIILLFIKLPDLTEVSQSLRLALMCAGPSLCNDLAQTYNNFCTSRQNPATDIPKLWPLEIYF